MYSKKFAFFLDKLKNEFDLIIVDLPPVGIVTDPMTIADHVNGYILIAMANKSDSKRINHAINTIRQTRAKITGIVVNATSLRGDERHHYSDRGYGYKRGYYNYRYGYKYGYKYGYNYGYSSRDDD
jgi:Mrp family chromosome partitioning ATPase